MKSNTNVIQQYSIQYKQYSANTNVEFYKEMQFGGSSVHTKHNSNDEIFCISFFYYNINWSMCNMFLATNLRLPYLYSNGPTQWKRHYVFMLMGMLLRSSTICIFLFEVDWSVEIHNRRKIIHCNLETGQLLTIVLLS